MSDHADLFVLGFSDDTRVLIDLLRAEAPAHLQRLVVVEPDEAIAFRLAGQGLSVWCASIGDPAVLGTRLGRARVIACFCPGRFGWSPAALATVLRAFSPEAKVFVRGASQSHEARDALAAIPRSGAAAERPREWRLGALLGSWRLWALAALTVVDGLVFMLPVTAGALLVAALVAPRRLRQAAGFLDALAQGRG